MKTSFATLFLGIWLLVAPVTFGYCHDTATSHNSLICGALLIISGWYSRYQKHSWAIWLGCSVGLWLQLAPLVFWAKFPASYVIDTSVGLLAILLTIIIPGIPGVVEKPGQTIPPGWSYNPSSYAQRLPIILLAIFSWFASRYLAAYQLGYISSVWDPFFGDGTLKVITSTISRSFPVPDAGLGAFAYSLEALLGCKGGPARWRTMPWLVVIFGILVVPVGIISISLIILQPLVVGAWCGLCLMIALAMLIMVALTLDELAAVLQLLRQTSKKNFWHIFWKGVSSPPSFNQDPPLNTRFVTLLKAGFRGCSLTWNSVLTILIGIWLVLSPSILSLTSWLIKSNHLVGTLVIATALIATADVARKVNRIIILLGIYSLAAAFSPSFSTASFVAAALPGVLLIICNLKLK